MPLIFAISLRNNFMSNVLSQPERRGQFEGFLNSAFPIIMALTSQIRELMRFLLGVEYIKSDYILRD